LNHRKLRWPFEFDSIPCYYGYFRHQNPTNHDGRTAAALWSAANQPPETETRRIGHPYGSGSPPWPSQCGEPVAATLNS